MGQADGEIKNKIEGLDDKFWVWETLEEATRPHMDELTKDEIKQFFTAWQVNVKGSDELHRMAHERVLYHFAQGPPFM